MVWNGVNSYNSTPGSNTAINGINIAEGCNASGINDAIRQMMADIASFAQGGAAASPGDIKAGAYTAAPAGWLACDGSAVSRTTYAALFSAIGTTWGAGDGSTTFNLPDYRGKTIVGAGTGVGLTPRSVGQSGGAESVTSGSTALTSANLPAHSHGYSGATSAENATHTHQAPVLAGGTFAPGASGAYGVVTTGNGATSTESANHSHTFSGTTDNGPGSGTGHTHAAAVMQPFAVALVVIKT